MRFKTSIALTLLLASLALLFFMLGRWQLERAGVKAATQAAVDQAPLIRDLSRDSPQYARLSLEGRFDPQRHILLDNKVFQGRPGVQVITPFYTSDGQHVLLVNRGWLPMVPDRSVLPEVETDAGVQTISGRLGPLSLPGPQIGDPVPLQAEIWPQLMVYPDFERIQVALALDLNPQVLYLDDTSSGGFLNRNWTPFTMGPDRHKAYAVQWFGLALTAIVIWLVLGISAGRRAEK